MGLRARSIVFWPGITMDIKRRRQSCSDCVKNAPSQPSLQTPPSTPPAIPFEETYADFFDCVDQHYLVVGDKLSSWSEVPKGSQQTGSNDLISCLRNYFSRFGVPEELASNGRPEFISNATKDFLSKWGGESQVVVCIQSAIQWSSGSCCQIRKRSSAIKYRLIGHSG